MSVERSKGCRLIQEIGRFRFWVGAVVLLDVVLIPVFNKNTSEASLFDVIAAIFTFFLVGVVGVGFSLDLVIKAVRRFVLGMDERLTWKIILYDSAVVFLCVGVYLYSISPFA